MIPAPSYPRSAERHLRRYVVGRNAALIRQFRKRILDTLGRRNDSVRSDNEAIFDFGPLSPEQALAMLGAIRRAASDTPPPTEQLEGVFARADRVTDRNLAQLNLGVIPVPSRIPDGWRSQNLDLIRDMDRKTLDRLADAIRTADREGWSLRRLSREVRDISGIGKRRAQVIARDQTGNLYSELTREKQARAGITEFVWITSADERVRDRHRALNGVTFTWANGHPTEGFPGQPIQCRCIARPIIPR